jgi:heterodisulfide reductase subunit C
MDYSPRQMIAMIRAGFGDEVLSSNTMWVCASCYLCTVRCPRNITITELMHALESIALRRGLSTTRTSMPFMYKCFVDSIMKNGRVHELGFMIKFYFKDSLFHALKNAGLGIKLLSHGRLSLKAERIQGLEQLKTMLKAVNEPGDMS